MGAHDLSCGRWFPNGLWKERLLLTDSRKHFLWKNPEYAYIIRSKEHEMILQKEKLEISIDRKAITNLKNISFIFEKESVSASRIRFSIRENSAIYGFGERFDSVNQYGKNRCTVAERCL